VVGAGLPRTGTQSQREALQRLLGGPCLHMSAIPGHPFDVGPHFTAALAGQPVDWRAASDPWVAAVDWPASLFWREFAGANPEALILLSQRENAQQWYESVAATILPYPRLPLTEIAWSQGRGITDCFEKFAGAGWDDPATLMAAYNRHNAEVVAEAPADRLVMWSVTDGWGPLCAALDVPVPDEPFPWRNRREDWS
jgi:hypothetical protein